MASRTRNAIMDSCVQLLEERPISKISVKDVVEECGINRNTFYYHFQDLPTLIETIVQEEADQLIEDMPKIEQLWVPDDKQREAKYKEAMNTCDYRAWVSIVKTLYIRKQERTAQGKKITALDERYMRTAENELYSELSLTLGIPKDEMEQYIRERLAQ